jgi:hypothetical protein
MQIKGVEAGKKELADLLVKAQEQAKAEGEIWADTLLLLQ